MKHSYFLARPLAALGLLLATAGAAQAQTFASAVTYGTGSIPQGIATVDVNGDGRLDIITVNSNSNNVGVLLGSATTPGTFPATATFYGSGGNFPVGLGVGDVNGDGRPDIVLSNASSSTIGVLLNSATTPGTFGAVTTYGSGTGSPRGLGLADANGDGRLDIITGGANTIGVLLNSATTPGTFGAATQYNTDVVTDGIAVGDVNGDGRPDVAVTGYQTTNTIGVLLSSATTPGTFLGVVNYGSGGVKPRGVTIGDVNGDGRPDLVAGNETSNAVGVLLNSATTPGTFGTAAAYASGANGPNGVQVRDMNGDGRPDIVAANYNVSNGSTVSLLLNSATTLGTFAAGTPYSSGGQGPVAVALGDLNNDGRPDIATTNVLSSNVGVLLNTTTFAPAPTLTAISPATGPAGTSVTLTGTNLTGATSVSFNGTAAPGFVVNSATQITVSAPAGATTGNVTVTTPSGTTGGQLFTVTYPDLVVSTTTAIAAGTYNSITVSSTGTGTLAGNVTVNSAVTVEDGGTLNDGCFVISGAGTFTLAAGGTLGSCAAAGLSSSGATGTVQTTGTRSFSPDASYVYNGTAAQSTGPGLPAQVRNLSTTNANTVTLSAATSVAQVLTVGAAGNLATGGNTLTLLSTSTGTALVVNSGSGVVQGALTAQRYIDGSLNAGPGYRHFSAPVSGATVAALATASNGFTPVLTQAYNTAAQPGLVTPFPNVFAYDESRIATVVSSYSAFDKGWVVPAATSTALAAGQGYSVNIAANQTVSFEGTAFTGALPRTLTRDPGADAGWALLGNPYPAPLDYSLVAPADRPGLDAAIYVQQSSGPYAGAYRSYVNNVGNPLVAMGQGFFTRVSQGQTSGTLTFRNTQRITDYGTQQAFQRSATDPRPQVQLDLRNASGLADAFIAYAEAGATPAFDAAYDAAKRPNTTGLNLASTTSGESLAIDGQPAFTAATTLPLTVGVPAAGTYTLVAATLTNLPTGLHAYLHDAATGQTIALSIGSSYAFTVTAAEARGLLTGRFTLRFDARTALATAPSLQAAAISIYPNPAHERFTVAVPAVAAAPTIHAELLNTLGQLVRRQAAPLPATGTTLTVETSGLAAGIYTLRLQAGAATIARRVVIQ